jgi:hypothetical protein
MSQESPPPDCCLPGDITITKVDRGFMLGRAIREYGQGAWWEYVKTADTYDTAVREARALARKSNARVWLYDNRDYTLLPDGDSPDGS